MPESVRARPKEVATFRQCRFIRGVADEKAPAKKPNAPKPPLAAPKKGDGVAKLVGWVRVVTLASGLLLSVLGLSAAMGVVTDILPLRAVVALVVVVGVPLFVADKILAKMKGPSDKLGVVLDVTAAFWMVLAWVFVGAFPKLLVTEGDRQTRAGSVTFAKVAYYLGGVTPTFREERSLVPPAAPSIGSSADAAAPKGTP
jgi:hypothetical protein